MGRSDSQEVLNGEKVDYGLLVHQLETGTVQMLSYNVNPTARGRLTFEGLCVTTSFPFGLFAKTAYYPVRDMAVACPQITPLDHGIVQGVTARRHEHEVYRRGSGNQLYNLRLYQSGDDSRSIHWNLTAKTSRLIVRETQAEEQRRARIYLDVVAPSTHDAVFERAVSFTASLVAHLFHLGYHLCLMVGSSTTVSAQADLVVFFEALALCERQDPDVIPDTAEHRPLTMPGDEAGLLVCVRPWDRPGSGTVLSGGMVFTPEVFMKEDHALR